jgi:anaerobic selenocysteine-containing dehydrogenase
MSRDQFDELARKLATATSRRQVLKGLAGGALAAAAGAGTLLRFRGAEASTAKLCCVYDCKSGTHFNVVAECITTANPNRGCPTGQLGCFLTSVSTVAKCSACGTVGGPT